MEEKESKGEAKPAIHPLNEVTVAFVFSFDLEKDLETQKTGSSLYQKEYVKSVYLPKSKEMLSKEKNPLLRKIANFEEGYYLPEYQALGRTCKIEFFPITLLFHGKELSAEVILTLHEYGVGTLTFLIENVNGLNFDLLRDIVFLNRIPCAYTPPASLEPRMRLLLQHVEENLTSIFTAIVYVLDEDGEIRLQRRIKERHHSVPHLSEGDYSLYVSVFLSDPGQASKIPEEFVHQHEKDIFELITVRFAHKDYDYHGSRSEEYVHSILSKRYGSRKHIAYYLTNERMISISLAKYYPHLYPYDYDWYLSYVSMLCMVRLEFQMLDRMYRALYLHRISANPLGLIELRKTIIRGLEEYHNLRFPVDTRTAEFIEHCKKEMGLNQLVEVIEDKLGLLTDSLTEYFALTTQRRSEALTDAVNVVSLIIAIPVSIEIVNQFLTHPVWYCYMVTWGGIVVSVFAIRKALVWLSTRGLRKLNI